MTRGDVPVLDQILSNDLVYTHASRDCRGSAKPLQVGGVAVYKAGPVTLSNCMNSYY